MYTQYWRLSEKPFENTPDPKYLYHSSQHEEGLSRLVYVVREGKGAGLLTGTYGCGKTLLGRSLTKELEKDIYRVAYISNPRLSDIEMLKMILHHMGATDIPSEKAEILVSLEQMFEANVRDGKKTVIVIDEAHAMEHPSIFEEIRLLLNFQTEKEFMINLLLIGQTELKNRIETNKQLNQRIAMRYHLSALSEEDTVRYIHHRLLIAGTRGQIFSDDALSLIHSRCGGIPRRINQVCDFSLLTGMTRNSSMIDPEVIKEALASLEN